MKTEISVNFQQRCEDMNEKSIVFFNEWSLHNEKGVRSEEDII